MPELIRETVTPPPLSLHMFGPMEVLVEGNPLPRLATRKRLWLLAILALRGGREVDRAWLAGALWPDSSDQKALANLRQSLAELRRALGSQSSRLRSSPRMVSLELNGAFCDLLEFDLALLQGEAGLRRAVEIYRGPLLECCTEDWVFTERESRELAYVKALEELADRALVAMEYGEAVRMLRLAIQSAPLNESLYRSLMRSLSLNGEGAAAAQVFRDLRTLLWRELNAAPAPETSAVYDGVRTRTIIPGPTLEATEKRAGRLPSQRTDLIGREDDVLEITRSIERSSSRRTHGGHGASERRLVTLTGTGGIGKTRLAIRVAAELESSFPDGVWFVDLSPLAEASLVFNEVARTLGLAESPERSRLEALAEHVRNRKLLLVLDNCEHVAAACASLCDRLLTESSDLVILATSRQPLRVAGETVRQISGLPLPPEGSKGEAILGGALACPSVQLFIERIRDYDPSFRLTEEGASAVAQICRRLDGVPLAIELAAARAKVLSLFQIAARLDDRLKLLTTGSSSAPPRHQTLRATIDWSYDLLTEAEQELLQNLSVFAGGWSLEAAQAVGAEPSLDGTTPAVLDLLDQLVGKSMVIAETAGREARYRMLETIRQYAFERLKEAGSLTELRRKHQRYFLPFVEEGSTELQGGDQAKWLEWFDLEHHNLREALTWPEPDTEDALNAIRLAASMQGYWYMHGHLAEGLRRFSEVTGKITDPQPDKHFANALNGAGIMSQCLGDWVASKRFHEAALRMRRELGDIQAAAGSLHNLAMMSTETNELNDALTMCEEAYSINLASGRRAWQAHNLMMIGTIYYRMGQVDRCESLYRQSIELYSDLGDSSAVAMGQQNLAVIAMKRGSFGEARKLCTQSLELHRKLADRCEEAKSMAVLGDIAANSGEISEACKWYADSIKIALEQVNRPAAVAGLGGVAKIAQQVGLPEFAAQIMSAADALRASLRILYPPVEQPVHNALIASLKSCLGEESFDRAWATGKGWNWEFASNTAIRLAEERLVNAASAGQPAPEL